MRGSIVKRSKKSWSLVVDLGYVFDPATGKKRRKQKWTTFEVPRDVSQRDVMKQAEAKLAELLHQVDKGTFIDASKVTLIDYLRDWHAKQVVLFNRASTAVVYLSMIEGHIAKSSLAAMPLQKVRASDLEAFYATMTRTKNTTLKLSPASVTVCHAVIRRALKIAVRDRLIVANPASAVENRPRVSKDRGQEARQHCWSADEARAVLAAARDAGPQLSALFAVLLDTGARKSEALGLTWADVDLDAGKLTIARQLVRVAGERAVFSPTKTGTSRTVTLGAETITRLRAHRKDQRELMMRNRSSYEEHNLVFAKQHDDLQTPRAVLGQACWALVGRHFKQVITAAGVRPIKVHGTRHTAATLLLSVGVPVHVVAQRLGHAQVTQTLETYAHALPDMQRDAANRLDALLADDGQQSFANDAANATSGKPSHDVKRDRTRRDEGRPKDARTRTKPA